MKFIEGNFFTSGGKKSWLVGVNYLSSTWGHKSEWWSNMDLGVVERDLGLMKSFGLSSFRIPLPFRLMAKAGVIDESVLGRLDSMIGLAKKCGLSVIVNLFMTGGIRETDWIDPQTAYTDERTLACEVQCVKAVVDRYRSEDTVIAYDICNEPWWMFGFPPPDPGKPGKPGRKNCAEWMRKFVNASKALNPGKPLTLGIDHSGVVFEVGGDVDALEALVDFQTTHGYSRYPIGGLLMDDLNSLRDTYYCSFIHRRAVIADGPSGCLEFGNSSQYAGDPELADHFRVVLWSLLVNGATSFFPWNFVDFGENAFGHYPYNPHEIHFGMLRSDGSPKPHAGEIKKFSETVAKIDPSAWTLERYDAAIYVAENYYDDLWFSSQAMFNAYCLAKEAGLNVGFIRSTDDWKGLKLIISPSNNLTLAEMARFRTWVADGGTLSLSSWVSYYPSANMSDCLGATVRQVTNLASDLELKPANAGGGLDSVKFGSMSGTYRAHLRLTTAEAVMTDANGEAVMLMNRFGKGTAFHSCIPFEFGMAKTPWSHRDLAAWKIYGLLKKKAGIGYAVEADHPSVETGRLTGKEGLVAVFVNHESAAVKAPLRLSFKPSKVTDLALGKEASFVDEVRLEPNGVKVYEFSR